MKPSRRSSPKTHKLEWKRALWRHKLLVVLVMSAGLALTVAWTLRQPKIYRCTASVLLESNSDSFFTRPQEMATPEAIRAQRTLAESRPVLRRIQVPGFKFLEGSLNPVPPGFEARVEGQLLYLGVQDRSSERAALLANAWSTAFVEEMTRRTLDANRYTEGFLKRSLPELRNDWLKKQKELTDLEQQTGFDPKEIETHPLRKRCEELENALTQKNIALAALQAEERVLNAPDAKPADWLHVPRAQTDTAIASARKQLDDRQVRLQTLRETLQGDSREIQLAERSTAEAQKNLEAAGRALALHVQVEAKELRQECEQLKQMVAEAEAQFGELRAKAARYHVLSTEVEMAEHIYSEMSQKENQTNLSGQFEYSYTRPWEQAISGNIPYLPSWSRNLALGFLLSILLAAGLVSLLEISDDTLQGARQLEEQLGVKTLGLIPELARKKGREGLMLSSKEEEPVLIESLRHLQIGLMTNRPLRRTGPLLLAVTSSLPGEGKSFICINLAETFARLNLKVLVVDADMHRASLSSFFNCQNAPGLHEALATGRWRENLHLAAPGSYYLLSAGNMSPDANRFIDPARLEALLSQFGHDFQVVLFDTTPVLALADTCFIAGLVEGTLVLARAGKTRLGLLRKAVERLRGAKARRLFFAVNGVDRNEVGAEGYVYCQSYYGRNIVPARETKSCQAT